jgi:acyl dehydratase
MSPTYLDDLTVGYEFVTAARTISESDIMVFAGLSGDFNPLHTDAKFAADSPFGQRIAHGMLIASVSTGLPSELDNWAMLAFLQTTRQFVSPVFIGDTVHVRYRVTEVRPSASDPWRGVVRLALEVIKQNQTVTQIGEDVLLLAANPQQESS